MQPNRLRHRVTFQEQVPAQEWDGAHAITWQNVSGLTDIAAEVLTGPGREAIQGGAKHGEVAARINLRYFQGLKHSWRILHDGNVYDITSIETDRTGRREYRLICKAGMGDGT